MHQQPGRLDWNNCGQYTCLQWTVHNSSLRQWIWALRRRHARIDDLHWRLVRLYYDQFVLLNDQLSDFRAFYNIHLSQRLLISTVWPVQVGLLIVPIWTTRSWCMFKLHMQYSVVKGWQVSLGPIGTFTRLEASPCWNPRPTINGHSGVSQLQCVHGPP